ncbi:hypothetical protein DM806_09135 [Sphingobium lactosutens]|uniref:hypothetical protein n=1 Tax=Sphingobium lactosutens TaxID=522773 RepID=UPI0015C0FBA6|nr:hypothetical protein [Sphingobium lactosutens]NWK95837.1 hypothetical protein [Sphingobium lactosutens]
MAALGVSLFELIGLPPSSTSLVPPDIRRELEKLAVVDFSIITSDDAFIYTGTIRSLGETLFASSMNWPIELPLLNVGVPFQLVRKRLPVVAGEDIEPAPDGFQIDLLLQRMAIVIPGLVPAKLVPSAGTTAAHLVRPVSGDKLFGTKVKIVGSGTLRIASSPSGGAPSIRFVAPPDPLDPGAPTGALLSLGFQPPHFFIGSSDYGMTVDTLVYDDSEVFTPADIEARGQGPDWRGISIKEATVYFPRNSPVVGDLSAGVRDVLLGSPLGLQGEIRIEFGTTPVNPDTLIFTQHRVGDPPVDIALGSANSVTSQTYRINLASGSGDAAFVSAAGPTGSNHRWKLPDGTISNGLSSGEFRALPGDWLMVYGLEGTEPDVAESPPITVQFVAAAPVALPSVNATLVGTTWQGVLSLSGFQEALEDVTLSLDPATGVDDYVWEFGSSVGAQTGKGATFAPKFPALEGHYYITVGKPGAAPQRIEIEVLPIGELIVGCRAGVFDGHNNPIDVRAIEGSYSLPAFLQRGNFLPAESDATVTGTTLSVPAETLASITVERNSGADPVPPPPAVERQVSRHAQILMDIDGTEPLKFIKDADNGGATEDFTPEALHEWRDQFSGSDFLVVGRACDIGTAQRNQDLASQRAKVGKTLLGASSAFQRGERSQWSESGADPGGQAIENAATEADGVLDTMKANNVMTPGTSTATAPGYDGWLFKIKNDGGFKDDKDSEAHDRPHYRRVDFHAVGGTVAPDPNAPPTQSSQAAVTLRRALVPGSLPPALSPPKPKTVARPYRVRLVIRWDSPTVTELSDAIPTQAEITVAWQSRALPVPGGTGDVTPAKTQPSAGGPEIFTFVGGWTYDPRTTATQFSLALNSTGDPDGLAMLTGDSAAMNAVATALAIGPALLAGIQSSDVVGGAARVAALVAGIGFAVAYGKDGKVVLHGVKIEWRQRAITSVEGARFRLLCDYTASIGFDFDEFGIRITANKPIQVRYRDVGIEIDSAKSGFDAFGVIYENTSFDIADPGQWTIQGPLGDLIRVTATRAGSGSTWVELDLAFALDLGVVKITGCTLRASFSDGGLGIEFRGFSASIDLPGVVQGSGGVTIGDGGLIRAGLAADILPINTSAMASLALQGDFVALEVGVLLPVGIPLAQSGLAIYGFVGRVVSNGQRNLVGLSSDPVLRELEWYRRPGQDKYSPAPGQWAMGLGISVGTMPDTGFTFNALGMLSVGFPDPDVVISIDASLFKKPKLPAADNNEPQAGLTILGVIAISKRAVVVGVKGTYVIPKVLKLDMPFGAYFPLPGNNDPAFVRVGADGVNGRTGDPVTLTLLPDTLDIRVWSYMMVEERNLLDLGGEDDLDLNGFSIGFGAGWAMKWGGGPVYLRASAKILAGMGTKPLTIVAGLYIEGELRLVIVSVSVRGNVKALITEQHQSFSGEFCGKVDFFFFSVEGCVDCSFGSGSDPGIPIPDAPLSRIDLTGRTGAIVGRAYRNGEPQDPTLPPIAWPDTVPLLNFATYIQNCLIGSSFAPNPSELPGVPWSGSTELKYAYRLTKLEIRKRGQAPMAGPLESVWWWPTHRSGVLNPADPEPSEHEGRLLGLLSWHPAPWGRNIADGGAGTPADPGNTVGQLCEPVTDRFRGCVRGDLLTRQSFAAVKLSGIAGTRFAANIAEYMPGSDSLADAQAAVALAGWQLIAGASRPFAPPLDVPSGPSAVAAGYQLARFVKGPQLIATLGARIMPTLALDDALLTLEVCIERSRGVLEAGCDDYADLEIGARVSDGVLQRPGVSYRWRSNAWQSASPIVDHFAPATDRKAELWVGSKGVVATFDAPTDQVALTVCHLEGEPVQAVAMDAAGNIVARVAAQPLPAQAQRIVLEGAGIVSVRIFGGSARGADGISPKSGGSLLKLCRGKGEDDLVTPILSEMLAGSEPGKPPVVEALCADGSSIVLEPKLLGATASNLALLARAATTRRCALVQYAAPAGQTITELRVAPWTGGRISVISLCGTDWVTRYVQTTNGDAQSGTAGSFDDHSDPTTSSERPNLLDADSEYEIVVGMQWVGWRRDRDDPVTATPPPLADTLDWKDFTDQVFAFRTAAEAALPANPPPADFKDERTFDPRGLMRYLIGFDPDGKGAPHFLDDPINVYFRADHIEPLLAKYGRSLRFKLRRTDPPPGALASPDGLGSSVRPSDMAIVTAIGLLPTMFLEASDALLVEAAEAAPCVKPPVVGGQAVAITADLEPDADYDLLLVAPPSATPEVDTVLITRSHFHTSRYIGPADMLAAMALPTDGSVDFRLPFDAMIEASVPAAIAIPNDADFETVMRALGLDPWPLPVAPRVVALWSKTAPFQLHGIMLETDEPMERGTRMSVSGISINGTGLQRIVANTATTRAIWMVASPVPLTEENVIDVQVSANGVALHGRRSVLKVPRLALLEGLA